MLGKIKTIVPISILISIMIVYLVSLLMKPTLSAVVTGVLFNVLVVTVLMLLLLLLLQLPQSTVTIKQNMKRYRQYLLLSILPFCLFWLSFHFDETLDLSRRIDVDYMFFAIIFGVTIIYSLTFIKLMKDWPIS